MKNQGKQYYILFFLLLPALTLYENCGKTEEEKPNTAPVCNITSPADNAAFALKSVVAITVKATDKDGKIVNVKISIDGTLVATLQSPPYTYDWKTDDAKTGPHNIKAVAADDGGLTDMAQITVDITAKAPVVTTAELSEVTDKSAKGGGNVTDDGGSEVTARGVVWNESGEPTLESNDGFTEDGKGTGSFVSSLTGLSANTGYHVRAYATNSAGTSYGEDKSLKTSTGPPTVTTVDISDIAAHMASGSFEITNDGGGNILTQGVVWSLTPNPDFDNNDGIYTTTTAVLPGKYEVILSALQDSSTYYVRAWAENENGIGYGEEKTFTTHKFTVKTGQFTDDRDDKEYKTVEIYGQVWMAENLAYLPEVCPSGEECGYWVYDYQGTDVVAAKATDNYSDYGVLYNWEMAKASCPAGWHLPSDEEWSLLEMNIGVEYSVAMHGGVRQDEKIANKLKDTGDISWYGTNTAKFSARPGGGRYEHSSKFSTIYAHAYFWTSSPKGNLVWYRDISINYIFRKSTSWSLGKKSGMSVRCLKD